MGVIEDIPVTVQHTSKNRQGKQLTDTVRKTKFKINRRNICDVHFLNFGFQADRRAFYVQVIGRSNSKFYPRPSAVTDGVSGSCQPTERLLGLMVLWEQFEPSSP